MDNHLLVLGASIVDIFGISTSKYSEYNSTPGEIKMSFGGVCRNIAENMARIGIDTKFISILGDDEKGRSMIEHSKVIGYDMSNSMIIKGGSTPTYMAILDEKGEMRSAIVDMETMNLMDENFIDSKSKLIESSKYTFLDADNPKILKYILEKYNGKTKFILDPISSHKAGTIKDLIHHFHTIKPNKHEAEVLSEMTIHTDDDLIKAGEYFLNLGIKKVFISLDEEGIFYADKKSMGRIKALNVEVKNVTGAGDSFVAGLGYGYSKDLCMIETVKFAMAMSILTISDDETIYPEMSYIKVKEKQEKIRWIEYTL